MQRNLNKLLNYGVAILGFAILAAMIGAGVVAAKSGQIARDAASYVETSVPEIVGSWNPAELERRFAPDMLSPPAKAELPAYFSRLSALGKIKNIGKPVGRIGSGAYPGTTINGRWAEYGVAAEFEHGKAQIELVLKRVDDGWQIAGFSVRRLTEQAKSGKP